MMRAMRYCLIPLFLLALLASGSSCRRQDVAEPVAPPSRDIYAVTGMVYSVHPGDHRVVVDHQEVAGYMDAMRMSFTVRDTNALVGLIPGEEITFNMIVTDDDSWIEDIKETGVAKNILPDNAGIHIARDVEPLEPGDELPDYPFVNEQGKAVQLNDYRGNALVVSFLFTRCPLPQFCPLTARKLVETQDQLLQNPGAPDNWRILAVSIDPEYDTPARLKQFGESYGYDPARFSLLTGERIDVGALAEQFGLLFWSEQGTVNHNLRTIVIGADGTVRTNMVGNEWAVDTLVREVRAAAE